MLLNHVILDCRYTYLPMASLTRKMHISATPYHLGVAVNQIYTYIKAISNGLNTNEENCAEQLKPAPFGTCLVSAFSGGDKYENRSGKVTDENEIYVNCELRDNKLIISKASQSDIEDCSITKKYKNMTASTLKIRHFEFCPALHMTKAQRQLIPRPVLDRNIGVAVSVILGKVLSINSLSNQISTMDIRETLTFRVRLINYWLILIIFQFHP